MTDLRWKTITPLMRQVLLLQPVDWETVKAFFRERAIAPGKEWLE